MTQYDINGALVDDNGNPVPDPIGICAICHRLIAQLGDDYEPVVAWHDRMGAEMAPHEWDGETVACCDCADKWYAERGRNN